ncbi:hypothetical protein DFS34DRAFT_319272 [Phlyctochytrium arcticum]|nr:hypothetical protein DFS34DRAFT_319272 [Phlyctochytrium arcticum]
MKTCRWPSMPAMLWHLEIWISIEMLPLASCRFLSDMEKRITSTSFFTFSPKRFKNMGKEEVLRALRSFLPWASSEDLEVFHSVIRAAIRPHDSESAAVITTMYLSATSDIGSSAFLAEIKRQNVLEREKRCAYSHMMSSFPVNDASRGTSGGGRSVYYNEKLATMAAHLKEMFERIMAVDGSFSIKGGKYKQHSATKSTMPGYELRSDISPPDALEASPPKRRKENGTTAFVKPAPGVLAVISERILPLPFWSADLKLGSVTELGTYRAYDFSEHPMERQPLMDITPSPNAVAAPPTTATPPALSTPAIPVVPASPITRIVLTSSATPNRRIILTNKATPNQRIIPTTPTTPTTPPSTPNKSTTPATPVTPPATRTRKVPVTEWLTVDALVCDKIPECHCDAFKNSPCEHLLEEVCVPHFKNWVKNLACTSVEVEAEEGAGDFAADGDEDGEEE